MTDGEKREEGMRVTGSKSGRRGRRVDDWCLEKGDKEGRWGDKGREKGRGAYMGRMGRKR